MACLRSKIISEVGWTQPSHPWFQISLFFDYTILCNFGCTGGNMMLLNKQKTSFTASDYHLSKEVKRALLSWPLSHYQRPFISDPPPCSQPLCSYTKTLSLRRPS